MIKKSKSRFWLILLSCISGTIICGLIILIPLVVVYSYSNSRNQKKLEKLIWNINSFTKIKNLVDNKNSLELLKLIKEAGYRDINNNEIKFASLSFDKPTNSYLTVNLMIGNSDNTGPKIKEANQHYLVIKQIPVNIRAVSFDFEKFRKAFGNQINANNITMISNPDQFKRFIDGSKCGLRGSDIKDITVNYKLVDQSAYSPNTILNYSNSLTYFSLKNYTNSITNSKQESQSISTNLTNNLISINQPYSFIFSFDLVDSSCYFNSHYDHDNIYSDTIREVNVSPLIAVKFNVDDLLETIFSLKQSDVLDKNGRITKESIIKVIKEKNKFMIENKDKLKDLKIINLKISDSGYVEFDIDITLDYPYYFDIQKGSNKLNLSQIQSSHIQITQSKDGTYYNRDVKNKYFKDYSCEVSLIKLATNIKDPNSEINLKFFKISDGDRIDRYLCFEEYKSWNITDCEYVVIPSNINYIGAFAFNPTRSPKNVMFAEEHKSTQSETIVPESSAGCISLTTMEITEVDFSCARNLKTIGKYSFQGNREIEEVDLSSTSLRWIKEGAFEGCCSLKEIKLPQTIKKISQRAFKNTLIDKLDLSETELEYFDANAFGGLDLDKKNGKKTKITIIIKDQGQKNKILELIKSTSNNKSIDDLFELVTFDEIKLNEDKKNDDTLQIRQEEIKTINLVKI